MQTTIIILITAAVVSTLNMACFYVGSRVRQNVDKGEEIKAPIPNPIKAWNERREKKEADKEAERLEMILHNVEAYDGTPYGQKDIPE